MNRFLPVLAMLALLMVSVSRVAAADGAALPGEIARALPPRQQALEAIDGHPDVERARGERMAGDARADGRRRGPHEWVAGGLWQQRDVGSGQQYEEWEASVERTVRLPGKASLDLRIADLERSIGRDLLADARHEVAVVLLESWVEWLASSALRGAASEAAELSRHDKQAVEARLARGDASAAQLDAAVAADAEASRTVATATLREEVARLALSARFPSLRLPPVAPAIDLGDVPALDWSALAAQVVAVGHEGPLADGRAAVAELRADRARQDRRPDPTVGVRLISERGGDETAMALFVSVPLGAGPRSAAAAEEAGTAAASRAAARNVRLELDLRARTHAMRATGLSEAWRTARAAATAARKEMERMRRGHELGGIGLAELLAARRRASAAVAAEIEARSAAYGAIARLLLDAHVYWIGEDGHAD